MQNRKWHYVYELARNFIAGGIPLAQLARQTKERTWGPAVITGCR